MSFTLCVYTIKNVLESESGPHATQLILRYILHFIRLRDWSLITGRGGLQNGRGGT